MSLKVAFSLVGIAVLATVSLVYVLNRDTARPQVEPYEKASENPMIETKNVNPTAEVVTSHGTFIIELYLDKTPVTAGNFTKLAREGFYNDTKFHRIIPNFMIQGGDPLSRESDASRYGTGGPGYTIEDEFVTGLSNVRGTISMANTGTPNSGGSQFFINLVDNVYLDFDKPPETSRHPVFGRVVEGMEVLDKIAQVKRGANDVPVSPVVVERITIK
jgi:peptidylprolyl isomerase